MSNEPSAVDNFINMRIACSQRIKKTIYYRELACKLLDQKKNTTRKIMLKLNNNKEKEFSLSE